MYDAYLLLIESHIECSIECLIESHVESSHIFNAHFSFDYKANSILDQ